MSRKLNHVAWSVATILVLLCLVVHMPSGVGASPVHSSNSALVPVTPLPVVFDKSANKGRTSLVSKVEEQQSQDERQTQTLIPGWLQDILNAEQLGAQQHPATSIWVPNLGFHYRGWIFNELAFHGQNYIAARNILNYQGRGQANIVLAVVSAITNTVPRYRYMLPDILPPGGCFKSAAGNQNILGRACYAYDDPGIFANLADYHRYLRNVVGIQNPVPMLHHHSEHVLLAYLYHDSQRCRQNGLQHAGCRLGQALQAAQLGRRTICLIDAFTLDLISIPNSVCVGCERALHRGDWLEGYSHALNVFCRRGAPNDRVDQRYQVLTSSFIRYPQSFGHISCAAINHPEYIPNLTNDGIHYLNNAPQGVVLHRLPYDDVQDVRGRCARVRRQLI